MPSPPVSMPPEYRALHKYLKDRYAETVRLTLQQIEDLIGVRLPDVARVDRDWWANPSEGAVPSPQSQSWIQADRTATPNLRAGTVAFARGTA
jgi:hypothetical protein